MSLPAWETSPLPPDKAELALAAWSAGRDTLDIARMLGVPESLIANELPKFLARRRLAKAFTEFRASRIPADREGRRGSACASQDLAETAAQPGR